MEWRAGGDACVVGDKKKKEQVTSKKEEEEEYARFNTIVRRFLNYSLCVQSAYVWPFYSFVFCFVFFLFAVLRPAFFLFFLLAI